MGPCAQYCPCEASEQKRTKTENFKGSYGAKRLVPFDSSWWADHVDVVGCQNRIKNVRVMPIQSWGKSGILAYFRLKIGYFCHIYWDMDFNFVLPIIYTNIEGQTQLEVNWTQIDYVGLQKTAKMALSQNAIFDKCQSPKFLPLLQFSMNLSETFRIDVNGSQLSAWINSLNFWSFVSLKSRNSFLRGSCVRFF